MYSTLNTFIAMNSNSLKKAIILSTNYNISVGTSFNMSPTTCTVGNQHSGCFIQGAVSEDGQLIILVARLGDACISTNGGSTWQVLNSFYWGVDIKNYNLNKYNLERAISSDKQTIFIGKYLSTNGGITWNSAVFTSNLEQTTMSGNGQYLYYAMHFNDPSSTTRNFWRSSNYGKTFVQQCGETINLGNGWPPLARGNVYGLSVSYSGQYVVGLNANTISSAGGTYVSTDYGVSYTLKTHPTGGAWGIDNNNWVAAGDTGVIYAWASNKICVSTNAGTTWTLGSAAVTNQFYRLLCNKIGDKFMFGLGATGAGVIWSTNYGTTTTSFGIAGTRSQLAFIDPNATTLYFMGYGNNNTSTMSNIRKLPFNLSTTEFVDPLKKLKDNGMMSTNAVSNSVSMSSQGNYILLGVSDSNGLAGGMLSLSTNSGVSWKNLNRYRSDPAWSLGWAYGWNRTAISDDGTILLAAASNSIFLSKNSGNLFYQINAVGNTYGLPTGSAFSWTCSSMNSNGSVMLIAENGRAPYLSNNSGTTFITLGTTHGLTATNSWNYSAISYTSGTYMLLSASTGLYLSTNTGSTWTKIDGTGNTRGLPTVNAAYTSVSISRGGDIMLAVQSALYYSVNYGVNWTRLDGTGNTRGLPTAASSSFVISGLSGDGQKILTGVTNSSAYLSTNGGTSFTVINSTSVVNGLSNATTVAWGQMAISDNGMVFYVNHLSVCFCYDGIAKYWSGINHRSTNLFDVGGTPRGNADNIGSLVYGNVPYNNVKFSRNGDLVLAALAGTNTPPNYPGISLQLSTDGGYMFYPLHQRGHWQENLAGGTTWNTACISHTGQFMIACTSTPYLSKNYGLIWVSAISDTTFSSGLIAAAWSCCAISAFGNLSILGYTAGVLYISTDTFLNYYPISGSASINTSNGLPITTQNWNKLDCSSAGYVILASITNGALYLSKNSGTSWTTIGGAANSFGMPTTGQPWSSLSVSYAEGTYMLVSANSGGLFLTTNTGTTWTQISGIANTRGLPTTASTWASCVVNQDGTIMAACVANGRLYYSTNKGVSWSTYTYPIRTNSQNIPWSSLSMTADGSKVFATTTTYDYFIITFDKVYV